MAQNWIFSLESYFKQNFQEFVKKLAWFQKIKAPMHPFYLITVLKIELFILAAIMVKIV